VASGLWALQLDADRRLVPMAGVRRSAKAPRSPPDQGGAAPSSTADEELDREVAGPARSAASANGGRVVALLAAPAGELGVGVGLFPQRLGMQRPGVLGPLAGRLGTVGVAKVLLQLGRLLVQLRGAAVGGKLTRLSSPSTFPCSPQLVRFLHHRPYPFQSLAVQSAPAART
jgi:hypothetical protein